MKWPFIYEDNSPMSLYIFATFVHTSSFNLDPNKVDLNPAHRGGTEK